MNERVEIPRSSVAFEFRLKVFSASFFALAILVTVLIFDLSRSINLSEILDVLFAGIVICVLYLLAIYVLWYQWQGTRYYLSQHALIVKQRTKGFFASYSEEIFTLKTIVSAKIMQSGYAQRYNYGDITVFMGNENTIVVLKDVDNPKNLSERLSSSIGVTTMQSQIK